MTPSQITAATVTAVVVAYCAAGWAMWRRMWRIDIHALRGDNELAPLCAVLGHTARQHEQEGTP